MMLACFINWSTNRSPPPSSVISASSPTQSATAPTLHMNDPEGERTVQIQGLSPLVTALGDLRFAEVTVGGHRLKVPGFDFNVTPELLIAIKNDAVLAQASDVPHIRDLGKVLENMVKLLAKDLDRDIGGMAAASMGFIVGVYIERLRLSTYERVAASGTKSQAAARKKGRRPRVGSVREALECLFPDWRKRPVIELTKALAGRFPDRDVDSLRRSIHQALDENSGG